MYHIWDNRGSSLVAQWVKYPALWLLQLWLLQWLEFHPWPRSFHIATGVAKKKKKKRPIEKRTSLTLPHSLKIQKPPQPPLLHSHLVLFKKIFQQIGICCGNLLNVTQDFYKNPSTNSITECFSPKIGNSKRLSTVSICIQ